MIPKVLFQTNKTEPNRDVVSKIQEVLGPEWSYEFYNDAQVIQFFEDHPLPEFPDILQKYHSFERGAHRADLFRYYYLYVKGGFFMDSDAMIYHNLDWISSYHFVSVYSLNPGTIFQGILGATPKNDILRRALSHAYHTDPVCLQHYHYFCEELYRILQIDYGYNVYLLRETTGDHGIANTWKGDKVVFKHFWLDKTIPLDKGYKIYPKNLNREL